MGFVNMEAESLPLKKVKIMYDLHNMKASKTKRKSKIKAVILAAGESSRFKPLSEKRHKSLTKLGGKAIIRHTLENLKKNGIKNVVIVHAPGEKEGFERELGGLRLNVEYAAQDEAKGTGDALRSALPLIDSDFLLMNAAHEDSEDDLNKILSDKKINRSIKLLASKSTKPWEYAVIEFENDKKIKSLTEKPAKGEEKSNFRTVGVYLLTKEFKDYMSKVEEGPYSLIDAFNLYSKDFGAEAVKTENEPPSLKYSFDLLDAVIRFTNRQKKNIHKKARISKQAALNGAVHVGAGTKIMENAVIHGPVWIGENCIIGNNAVIRENSVIENSVHLGTNTEIKRSYVGEGTHIHSGYVGDSVIGENCRIGAGFITANRRLDRGNIKFAAKDQFIDSQKTYLGCVIGENTKIGINASTMPGTIIGSNCIVGSGTEVSGTIDSNNTVYAERKIIMKPNEK